MNNIQLLNKIAVEVATNKSQSHNGKIIRKNPNNTFDVKIDGSSTALRNLKSAISGETYYINDPVVVTYPTGNKQLAVIAGKSNFEVPDETIYEFEWE